MPGGGSPGGRDGLAVLAGLIVLAGVLVAALVFGVPVVPGPTFVLAPVVTGVLGRWRTVILITVPSAVAAFFVVLIPAEGASLESAIARAVLCLVGGLAVAALAWQRDQHESRVYRSRILDRLHTLTERLARTLEPLDVAGVIVDHARAVVGADRALVYLAGDGSIPQLAATSGFGAAPAGAPGFVVSGAVDESLRQGRVVALDRRALAEIDPALERTFTTPSPYVAIVPLQFQHELLGTAVFGFDRADPRQRDARSFVAMVGVECAHALRRAVLLDEARRSADHVAVLQGVTAALANAFTVDEVSQAVLEGSRQVLGADTGAVVLAGRREGGRLVLAASEGADPGRFEQWRHAADGTDLPIGQALRRNELLTFQDGAAMLEAFPALASAGASIGAGVFVPIPGRQGAAGVLAYTFGGTRRLNGAERQLLTAIADQCGQALQRAELLEIEQAEHDRWRAMAVRAVQIDELNAAFSAALTPDDLVAAFQGRGLEVLGADFGALLALEDGAEGPVLRPLGGRADTAGTLAGIPAGLALPLDGRTPSAEVAATGKAQFYGRRAEIEERYPAQTAAGGEQAHAIVPLRAYETVLGVLDLRYAEERPFDADEQAHLISVGQRCAEALERSRLYAAEHRSRVAAEGAASLLAEMQAVSAALTGVSATREVGPLVLPAAMATLQARSGAVLLAQEGQVQVLSTAGTPGLADRWPFADSPDLGDVIKLDEALVVTGIDPELATRGPLRAAMAAGGSRSLALMPLRGRDTIVGVLAMGWVDSAPPSPATMSALATFAGLCGQAIERTRAFDAEHDIATTLQLSLLPALPSQVGRVELAGRYRAGATGTQVGGDWFDAFSLPGDRVCLVIGDVEGRGVRAATTMGQLRAALRAVSTTQHDPGGLLHVMNTTLLSAGGPMATMAVVVVDAEGVARYAYAGHPPVYARDPDGQVTELEGGRSIPLGVMEATYRSATARLADGTALAMYTDGLVERRDRPLDEGLDAVSDAMAGTVEGLDALADRLIGLVSEHEQPDDVAVLVARFGHLDRLRFAPLASLSEVPRLRATLAEWLRERHASEDDVLAVTLAVSEAAVNSLQHAYPLTGGLVEVEVRCDDGEVEATIADHGSWRAADPRRGGGRGLALVHRVTDAEVVSGPEGTTVHLRRRLGALL